MPAALSDTTPKTAQILARLPDKLPLPRTDYYDKIRILLYLHTAW